MTEQQGGSQLWIGPHDYVLGQWCTVGPERETHAIAVRGASGWLVVSEVRKPGGGDLVVNTSRMPAGAPALEVWRALHDETHALLDCGQRAVLFLQVEARGADRLLQLREAALPLLQALRARWGGG